MMTQEDRLACAGLIAASGLVVAKQLFLREPLPVGLPLQFRPSGLGDLPRLFSQADETSFQRVARLSSAALVYSVNKKNPVQAGKLLRGPERARFDELHEERRNHFATDRSCPHCRLLFSSLYLDRDHGKRVPPLGIVNHGAHVKIDFDPETNVSGASISNFQAIVPERVAMQMVALSHPLHWADPAGSLFRRSEPIAADGTRGRDLVGAPDVVEGRWEQMASEQAFIFEDVTWPVSDDLAADCENIIGFRHFERGSRSLSYDYFLERCIRSNFGVAWEPSGLDVDGGTFKARVVPIGEVADEVERGTVPLAHLTRRDRLEMSATYNGESLEKLYKGWSSSDECNLPIQVCVQHARDAVIELGLKLEAEWPDLRPFCLVTVSASKQLHFTIPENGPIEQWQLLTWTAPSILFAFLNRAVCQAPHVLIDELVSGSLTAEAGGPYVTSR